MALPVQMKELTGSAVAVGAIGAVELVPLIVFGLYGGALADALDKRKLIVWTETGQGLLCSGLLANTLLPEPLVRPLYLVAALSAVLTAIQRPAPDSLTPRIVAHEHLPAAALNSLRWTVGGGNLRRGAADGVCLSEGSSRSRGDPQSSASRAAPFCQRGSPSHSRLRSRAVSIAWAASSGEAYGPIRSLPGHSGPSSTFLCSRQ